MTRILLLGKDGQVGWELARALPELGELHAYSRQQADLADPDGLRALVQQARPDVIINAAAYTEVDRAESEPQLAMAVNGAAPGLLAEEVRQMGALLLHLSTDYVFDGNARQPYRETDPPNPISVYGRSKLAGEQAVRTAGARALILRTSWVYSLRRESFVTKVLSWARQRDTLRIVDDQWGSPTWCRTLAAAAVHALSSLVRGEADDRLGLYHVVCRGAPSRYELAEAALKFSGLDPQPSLERASNDEFPARADRPAYSALDPTLFEKTFGYAMPDWQSCLQQALASGTKPGNPPVKPGSAA